MYLAKKPSGIDFVSYVEEIAKMLGRVDFAGIKDSIATAYFYVSSDRKILNPGKNIWFIGQTTALSPAFNSGNSFRISIEISDNRNCRERYDALKEKICNLHPAYFANFYGYQRFGLKRPTNHVTGKTLKKGNLLGTWLYIRSKYNSNYIPLTEKRILGKARGKLSVIPSIQGKIREIILESYTSYFFNSALTLLLEEIGGLIFETEPLLPGRNFWINKTLCGNRLHNAYFVKTDSILNQV
ncbi:MAG: tRNA pseudouridine(13) synthase TruD, partial [Desulfurococcales archaeon]|nr:tRNA pseudouridine(13) synthase TruD [Desulfurococcales archaeon]